MQNLCRRCHVCAAVVAMLCLIWQAPVAASTFTDRILAKPRIPQPSNPFVLVFLQGGGDHDRYGFVSGGEMATADWRDVFKRVGYLGAYSAFKPEDDSLWAAHGQDIAVRAAQSLGRPTGGSIMGVPTTAKEAENLKRAYSQDICDKMSYFFDDDERDYGVPGGSGAVRLRIEPNGSDGFLYTPATAAFDTGPAAKMASFQLSFGANFDHYAFGGNSVIVGDRAGGYGMWGRGWFVEFRNEGGYFGSNRIRFFSDGSNYIESIPFDVEQARRWTRISITVTGTQDPEYVRVAISIAGVGSSIGRLKRPTFAGGHFVIGDPTGQEREIDFDDFVLYSIRGGAKTVVAKYDFDRPGDSRLQAGSAIERVRDESGHGHDLISADRKGKYLLRTPTTGIDPGIFQTAKAALVDWLKAARRASGNQALPILITNWHLGNRPGRFAAWKSAGFTNGSIDCYLSRKPRAGQTNIVEILDRCSSQAPADAEAISVWSHAWLGNVHPDQASLAPSDYQTLITMAVLAGYRWFSVFTAMSNGSLGSPETSHKERAIENADALYNMAEAASWFQSTSGSLSKSQVLSPVPLVGKINGAMIRARINLKTSEIWVAGFSPSYKVGDKMPRLVVKLPRRKGTVTNLSTGKTTLVYNGRFTITLNDQARPFYFHPLANRQSDGNASRFRAQFSGL